MSLADRPRNRQRKPCAQSLREEIGGDAVISAGTPCAQSDREALQALESAQQKQKKPKKYKVHNHESRPTRVFRLGAYRPGKLRDDYPDWPSPLLAGEKEFSDQLFRAQNYRWQVTSAENERRAHFALLEEAYCPDLKLSRERLRLLNKDIFELEKELKQLRVDERKRVSEPELSRRIKAKKADRESLDALIRSQQLMARRQPGFKEENEPLNLRCYDRQHAAYHGVEIQWGTKNMRKKSLDQAQKDRKVGFLRTPPFVGDGALGVQLTPGYQGTLEELLAQPNHTYLRLSLEPEMRAHATCSQHKQRFPNGYPVLRVQMQVGDTRKKSIGPKWVTLRVILHREFPHDAVITNAAIRREKVGPRSRYYVDFTLAREGGFVRPPAGPGRAGMSLHFSHVPAPESEWPKVKPEFRQNGTLIVARIWDGERLETIKLPPKLYDREFKASALHSRRDEQFNAQRALLLDWLKTPQGRKAPGWLKSHRKSLEMTKSQRKLAQLYYEWKENRFPGDEDQFARLEDWQQRDRHLWRFESSLLSKLRGYRKDFYRKLAYQLRRKYGQLAVIDLNLKKIAERAKTEDEESLTEEARRNRKIAALSVLLTALEQSGPEVKKIPAKQAKGHAECGRLLTAEGKRANRCTYCDQPLDDGATARYLYAQGLVDLK